MIASALQVVPQTWPTLLQPHPWAVGAFVLTGAVMFVYAALGRKEPESGNNNTAGRDNTGYQINAPHSTFSIPSTVGERHDVSPSPSDPLPTLVMTIIRSSVIYESHLGRWMEGDEHIAIEALLVEVTNPRPDLGKNGYDTGLIIGHLEFFDLRSTRLGAVDRAFWIKESSNRTSIDVGERKKLLLGVHEEENWYIFQNPHKFQMDRRFSNSEKDRPLVDEQSIPGGDGVLVRVSIISAQRRTTLATSEFRIT